MWNHWAVRASTPYEPFKDFQTARWVWGLFSGLFPNALAAVLMPNHLHLILPAEKDSQSRSKISGALGAISRKLSISRLWQPMSPPSDIPDRHHLKRQIRYIALNPCRRGLCGDPLEWMWSTYRDVMGAAANPRVPASRVNHALGGSKRDFQVRLHTYVSGDPSVAVQGTPAPRASGPAIWAREPIVEILAACAASRRAPMSEVRKSCIMRRQFVHLAARQGWRQTALLSEICGTTPRAIQLIRKKGPLESLAEAALCLGDTRLRKGLPRADFAKREKNALTPRG